MSQRYLLHGSNTTADNHGQQGKHLTVTRDHLHTSIAVVLGAAFKRLVAFARWKIVALTVSDLVAAASSCLFAFGEVDALLGLLAEVEACHTTTSSINWLHKKARCVVYQSLRPQACSNAPHTDGRTGAR